MFSNSRIPMSKRVRVSPIFERPCNDCVNFRWLSVRYGVCDCHEHPSEPRECSLFKRKIKR